ncbi:hypothetical protein GJ744_003718 [Endocarpon pusillum]|uniref:Uncharacterized protein n=1 Tax=Endocarpon pusillum TaxID=364733 RepID=A0A8H7A8Q5_9EURO|nr:hypothetical protein GJ744_003718 [Endocarpon pusillum]
MFFEVSPLCRIIRTDRHLLDYPTGLQNPQHNVEVLVRPQTDPLSSAHPSQERNWEAERKRPDLPQTPYP